MATTHTEVYRRFRGELSKHPLRWWPLFQSEYKVATRKKLPLLLLFGPVAIASIVYAFIVYMTYTFEELTSGQNSPSMGLDFAASVALAATRQLLKVRALIVQFYGTMSVFCLLSATWFGAGLICEDRRFNAHLLYFSRPLNRLDYFLGKFVTVSVFGAFSMLLPGLLICTMAVLNSPDYSFLKEQGDVIVNSTLFALLWIVAVSSVVLAVSSLAPKKLFALVGVFAFFSLTALGVQVAREIGDVPYVAYLSLADNLVEISGWMLSPPGTEITSEVWNSLAAIVVVIFLSLMIVARRLKKMELSL